MPLQPIQFCSDPKFAAWALIFFAALGGSSHAAESVRHGKAMPARPYVLRGAERRLLDRAEQFAEEEQWDDALAAIMRLLATDISAVVKLDDQDSEGLYVSLRESCHRRLAKFPAETLLHYRQWVDASSQSWYEQGLAARDERRLQRIVEEFFCSHWGDDALFALGELALQRGDYQAARNAWLQISPLIAPTLDRLTYPDTDIPLAAVLARLVLVSVREGDWQRAERELADLREGFPTATGRLGGKEVVFVDQLTDLLKQAQQGPAPATPKDWRTYGATSQRAHALTLSNPEGPYQLLWSQPIDNEQLSIFPILVNDLLVYQDATAVHALHLSDGEKAFTSEGSIFLSPHNLTGWLGHPQYTLTATKRSIFGITTAPLGPRQKSAKTDARSSCWSLDLARGGALEFHQRTDEPHVAFVGAPIVDEQRLYVAVRENNRTARVGVACYDHSTGERCWQRWLCQANTPATGWTSELANNLLTCDAGILYINTNLGAVAAVRAENGEVLWLHTYPRKSAVVDSKGECAYYGSPNPCVYQRGVVVALPSDSDSLLAFDATTGKQLWRHDAVDPSLQIFGILEGRLVLVSAGLQAFDLRTGQVLGQQDNPWGDSPFAKQSHLLSVGETVVATGKNQISVYRKQPQKNSRSQKLQTSPEE